MPFDTATMFGSPTPSWTSASDSDTQTYTLSGSATVAPFITSPQTLVGTFSHTYTFNIDPTNNATIVCPWTWTVATGKTATFATSQTTGQKITLSGQITTTGTGRFKVMGGAASLVALSYASGITYLQLANNADQTVEVATGTIAASGATIRFDGSSQILRWATGNTTDYSSSSYTKSYGSLGFILDPNGQTITFASAWSPGGVSIQMGNSQASRRVNGGRLKFNGNETVGRGFYYIFAGTTMELNGTFTGSFGSNEVGQGGGTSSTMIAGLEGTGTTAQDWQVDNTAYTYVAGGTTGNNGVLTVHNLTFQGANSELHVYSDGTANNCSKPHATGTWTNANQKIRLVNTMAAGTYTIGDSAGTMSGTAPTSANVIENLTGRTVVSITQVGNALQMVLV